MSGATEAHRRGLARAATSGDSFGQQIETVVLTEDPAVNVDTNRQHNTRRISSSASNPLMHSGSSVHQMFISSHHSNSSGPVVAPINHLTQTSGRKVTIAGEVTTTNELSVVVPGGPVQARGSVSANVNKDNSTSSLFSFLSDDGKMGRRSRPAFLSRSALDTWGKASLDTESKEVFRRRLHEADTACMHPFWLQFFDSGMERRYKDFLYVNSGFYGGKLWHVLAIVIIFITFFYYHSMNHGFSGEMFIKPYWASMTASLILSVATFVCCFFRRLAHFREWLFLASLTCHWPSFVIVYYFGMGETPFFGTYLMIIGCLFFCTFVVQARFSRLIWFLVGSPVLTLVISTNTFPVDFWSTHSPWEPVLWFCVAYPIYLLRVYEKYSRVSFLNKDRCEGRIQDMERRIDRARVLMAKLFPRTPTLDLLTDGHRMNTWKVYIDTAVVVTDLVGFTAWTSRTPPSVVISTLSQMFENIDSMLEEYFIEKVSTVGDGFIGVSFPREERVSTEERCAMTLCFCCKILPCGQQLKLRIGTHIGEVTGAFVGSAPPKFDIFGEDVEIAKVMEQDGVPGKVHTTSVMLQYAESCGRSSIDWEVSPRGSLLSDFELDGSEHLEKEMARAKQAVFDEEELEILGDSGGTTTFLSVREMYHVSKALISMSQPVSTTLDVSGHTANLPVSLVNCMQSPLVVDLDTNLLSEHPLSSDGEDMSSTAGTSTERSDSRASSRSSLPGSSFPRNAALPNFHPVLLTFEQASHESRFVSGLERRADVFGPSIFICVCLQLHFTLAFLLMGLTSTTRNRGILASIFVIIAINFGTLRYCEVRNLRFSRKLTGFFIATLVSNTVLSVFMDSDGSSFGIYITGVFISCNVLVSAIIVQFMLNFRLTVRVAINVVVVAIGYCLSIIRTECIQDDVLPYDVLFFLLVPGLGGVSFFADYSLRSLFVSERRMLQTMGISKSRYNSSMRDALEVMLPGFVCERLLLSDEERHSLLKVEKNINMNAASSTTVVLGSDLSPTAAASSDYTLEGALFEDNVETIVLSKKSSLWEFHSVAVMFVVFYPAAAVKEHTGEEVRSREEGECPSENGKEDVPIAQINSMFHEIEHISRVHNIHKIKTIGTAVMCVYGINDDEADPVNVIVKTALDIRRKVLETKLGWTYTFGIHLGPCTGAVMGTESLMFDIFGDSVNMASRMASTAPPKGIQLSPGAAVALSDDFKTEKRPPIQVKGKGQIEPILVARYS